MAKKVVERAAEIRAIIESEPGIRQCDIAERMGVSRASITLATQELAQSEDIVKKRHPDRGYALTLSRTGLAKALLRKRWR